MEGLYDVINSNINKEELANRLLLLRGELFIENIK
jgi:hypothetical protein